MANAAARLPGPLAAFDATMPEWQRRVEKSPLIDFVDYCLRGVGQVCFMNNPITGAFILAGMFVFDDWLGTAGLVGVAVSTITALLLGFDRGAVRAGLFGFNGVLVGAGLATFLGPQWDGAVFGWIILVAALSSVFHAALAAVMIRVWKVPPFTLAFNFTTLMFLVGALQFAHGRFGGVLTPTQPTIGGVDPAFFAVSTDSQASDILTAIFNGIGQLFFAQDVIAGILMIVGLLVCSRIAGVMALVGSAVGMLVGLAVGASGAAIYAGLWGFNSFDAALAVAGVFFVLSLRSFVLGVGCAILAALFFGALSALFQPWGLPALTLPFCLATIIFVLLKFGTSSVEAVEIEDITTPEEHLAGAQQARQDGVGRDPIGALSHE